METANVSAVIPARNRRDSLLRAIESVRTQSVRVAALIVVDDGSTDGTAAALSKVDDIVVLRNLKAEGAGQARNRGVGAATTEWIAFLDSDDVWMPNHIETIMKAPCDLELVTSAMVDSRGRLRGTPTRSPQRIAPGRLFFPESMVCTSTTRVRADTYRRVGGFRTLDRAEDLDLWLRILKEGPGEALPIVTARYASPDAFISNELRERNDRGVDEVLRLHSGSPWLTRRVYAEVETVRKWDAFRHFMHRRQRVDSWKAMWQLMCQAFLVPTMSALLLHRARMRNASRSLRRMSESP